MQKRQFIKDLLLTGVAMPLGFNGMAKAFASHASKTPFELAQDNGFWEEIRQQYILKPDYINLEKVTGNCGVRFTEKNELIFVEVTENEVIVKQTNSLNVKNFFSLGTKYFSKPEKSIVLVFLKIRF
jgi:hypothetical protein